MSSTRRPFSRIIIIIIIIAVPPPPPPPPPPTLSSTTTATEQSPQPQPPQQLLVARKKLFDQRISGATVDNVHIQERRIHVHAQYKIIIIILLVPSLDPSLAPTGWRSGGGRWVPGECADVPLAASPPVVDGATRRCGRLGASGCE